MENALEGTVEENSCNFTAAVRLQKLARISSHKKAECIQCDLGSKQIFETHFKMEPDIALKTRDVAQEFPICDIDFELPASCQEV